MKTIFVFTLSLMMFYSINAQAAWDDEWFLCQNDSDCVVTRAPCKIIAVHKDYLKAAEDEWNEVAPKIECAAPPPHDLSIFKATCGYATIPCVKKSWFGLKSETDHGSSCMSSEKRCIANP